MKRYVKILAEVDIEDVLDAIDNETLNKYLEERGLGDDRYYHSCRELQTRRIPPHPVRCPFAGLSSVR